MISPKEKVSKARRNSRKANWKATTPSIVECPHCKEPIKPHTVCKNCGYYNGEKKIKVKADKKEAK